MHELILFLGIFSALALGSNLPAPAKVHSKECGKIIGCNCIMIVPDEDGGLLINDIDVHLCTHLFYSFVGISANASIESVESYADLQFDGYNEFNELRKKNPKLKTLATIQVIHDGSTKNYDNKRLLDPNLREKLVNNIVNFVKKYRFSGVDIDYSDPPTRSGSPSDKKNFVLLLKALRERFDKERLILSVRVDPIEANAKILYDIKGISTYVDFINLKTYDFHRDGDKTEKKVGHTSPLYHSSKENAEERKMNIDYVVNYWTSQLAPPSKLILGTSLMGASYTLTDPKQFGRGAPIAKEQGQYYGVAMYDSICSLIQKWTYLYDNEQQVPYIHKRNQIIAFDDVRSMRAKAVYADKKQLGGVMVDIIDYDDYDGHCGEKFAILKTLNRVLRNKC